MAGPLHPAKLTSRRSLFAARSAPFAPRSALRAVARQREDGSRGSLGVARSLHTCRRLMTAAALPIKRPVAGPSAWPVHRQGLPNFIGAKVRGATREPVVDVGNFHPCIDCLAAGLQCEIQLGALVWLAVVAGGRWRVRRLKAFEDVVVDFDAVRLLAGGRGQLRECLEPLRLSR